MNPTESRGPAMAIPTGLQAALEEHDQALGALGITLDQLHDALASVLEPEQDSATPGLLAADERPSAPSVERLRSATEGVHRMRRGVERIAVRLAL